MYYLIPKLFAQDLRSHYDQQAAPVILTSYKAPILYHAVKFVVISDLEGTTVLFF